MPNVYLLEGGLNHWLDLFGHPGHAHCPGAAASDHLRHSFPAALGSRYAAAAPEAHEGDPRFLYFPKVEIKAAKAPKKGGCG